MSVSFINILNSQSQQVVCKFVLIFRLNALVNFLQPSRPLFFSGDPHQFEQKFNYRRPMYPILKYMWAKDDYRESVKVKKKKNPV